MLGQSVEPTLLYERADRGLVQRRHFQIQVRYIPGRRERTSGRRGDSPGDTSPPARGPRRPGSRLPSPARPAGYPAPRRTHRPGGKQQQVGQPAAADGLHFGSCTFQDRFTSARHGQSRPHTVRAGRALTNSWSCWCAGPFRPGKSKQQFRAERYGSGPGRRCSSPAADGRCGGRRSRRWPSSAAGHLAECAPHLLRRFR